MYAFVSGFCAAVFSSLGRGQANPIQSGKTAERIVDIRTNKGAPDGT